MGEARGLDTLHHLKGHFEIDAEFTPFLPLLRPRQLYSCSTNLVFVGLNRWAAAAGGGAVGEPFHKSSDSPPLVIKNGDMI